MAARSNLAKATITTANEAELTKKHSPMPSAAMTPAAKAGPTARAMFMVIELSETALRSCYLPTSSRTIA